MAKIVVIEDDIDISQLIRDVLRESDHDVISYVRPNADIVEHLRLYQPDLVLLEAHLDAALSSWDIIESLKSDTELTATEIILVSGAPTESPEHRDLLQHHGVPVLRKPFDVDELHAIVERQLVS